MLLMRLTTARRKMLIINNSPSPKKADGIEVHQANKNRPVNLGGFFYG